MTLCHRQKALAVAGVGAEDASGVDVDKGVDQRCDTSSSAAPWSDAIGRGSAYHTAQDVQR
ncbi:hypothetical protein OHB44_10100 [Micromonospora sp. NBC_00821]|uniref:hypothetical protein n=1 Tax=Micromonospora sp. NBC_00821 TaxID=2975977 RepID=UPI002ED663B0|nr:hypothetical protein OHB44_10100 [Micromonospora sp. NBC_00821]